MAAGQNRLREGLESRYRHFLGEGVLYAGALNGAGRGMGRPRLLAPGLLVGALAVAAAGCRSGEASPTGEAWQGVDPVVSVVPALPSAATSAAVAARQDFVAAIRRGATLEPPPLPVPPPVALAPAPGLQMNPTVGLPGGVLVLRIFGAPELELSGRLAGYGIRFQKGSDFSWALVGLDPWVKPGTHTLEIDSVDVAGNGGAASIPVAGGGVTFPEESVALPASAGGPLTAGAQAEFERVEGVVRRYTSRQLWEGTFQMPVAGQTTSVFGARRSYSGRPADGQHTGWDLAAPSGTPIVAPNHGQVVLVGLLPSRGNTVILDHGLGVYSLYLHLSRILVREGDKVAKGQQIGLVGATGLATGPHLHWEVRVGGATVDPALWLQHAYGE